MGPLELLKAICVWCAVVGVLTIAFGYNAISNMDCIKTETATGYTIACKEK